MQSLTIVFCLQLMFSDKFIINSKSSILVLH